MRAQVRAGSAAWASLVAEAERDSGASEVRREKVGEGSEDEVVLVREAGGAARSTSSH